MPGVVHFEISANEPEKAADFQKNMFGWKVTKWEGLLEYCLIETGEAEEPGINVGIMRTDEQFSGTVNSVVVTDIDPYIEKVKQHGGEIVVDEQAIPGVGQDAYGRDVDGNLFGIHQEHAEAK